ncbi:hypothetical protein OS493_030942 [Desmophyllum pertusum]|uniref:Mff-like domain-containing protein n=1 Tax=Desmophyllum pertusum TaxID=174260 RepID=A0A9W9ZJT7_9CNID|nr:hypothetical protein OS493_030942 [Desmophyllum pertusum]
MAGMAGDLSANTPLSFDFPDGRVGDDLSQKMRIPQKITVPGDDEEYHSNTAKGNASDGITSMSIPDRIEIGHTFPEKQVTTDSPSVRGDKDRRAKAAQHIDDESIAVGLEVIEEGTPLDSDTDIGHYMGSDMSDTRKCILQVQQLNRRVRDLERNVDSNSVGFWSKIAFFAFTIINPIILHWLFVKRR